MPIFNTDNQDQGIFTVDFSFRIQNRAYDFGELRAIMYANAKQRLSNNDGEQLNGRSPIESVLREELHRMFMIGRYSEREGSFVIAFTMLFTGLINYKPLAESISLISEHVEWLLTTLSPAGSSINSQRQLGPPPLVDVQGANETRIPNQTKRLRIVFWTSLGLSITALLLSAVALNSNQEKATPQAQYPAVESVVRGELDKMEAQKTAVELLRILMEIRADSIHRGIRW